MWREAADAPLFGRAPITPPAGLIDPAIRLCSMAIGLADPSVLHPQEMRALPPEVVALRRREFTAGRLCAGRAMEQLGLPRLPVPAAPDRSPVWPAGVVGSISHSRALAAAALAKRSPAIRAIGLDVEEMTPLEADLFGEICGAEELAWLGRQPLRERGLLAKSIFCAKEAAYKCQHPLSGRLFGFHTLSVALDWKAGRFTARLEEDVSPFREGDVLAGIIWRDAGHLVALATC
ncbi:MAG: phosphopantetheinyl transferase [Mesorhizobium amorphae]|nr:MAG: phosphopantetheinyl transferase [Mesorhizobium amorphae]